MWTAVTFDEAAKGRISEAAKFERTQRLDAVLGRPAKVGPFNLSPLTLRQAMEMDRCENALAVGGNIADDDLLHVLFLASPKESTENQKRFFKWAAKWITVGSIREEVTAWFNSQFGDMPTSGSAASEGSEDNNVWACTVIDVLASEYGWTVEHCMSLPVATIFQLYQRILKRVSGGKYQIRNGITQRAKALEMNRMAQVAAEQREAETDG